MPNSQKKFLTLYQIVAIQNFLPSSGASLAIFFILTLHEADAQNGTQKKSAIISLAPHRLGSQTRRRHVLDFLVYAKAVVVSSGRKKSEKIVNLSQKPRAIMESVFV